MPAAANRNAPVSTAGWHQWALANYFPLHVELLQTDANGNGVGVMNLAGDGLRT